MVTAVGLSLELVRDGGVAKTVVRDNEHQGVGTTGGLQDAADALIEVAVAGIHNPPKAAMELLCVTGGDAVGREALSDPVRLLLEDPEAMQQRVGALFYSR